MEIKQNLCPPSKYSVKCPYIMHPIGVCIHNTANNASAKNEIAYMLSNNNKVSFHYAVDDKEIIQGIPNNRNAWHAGDGGSGKGNRKYLSIEICYSKSGGERFEKAMKNAAWLTAKLIKDYGWDISHIKKHQDFNGKHCPHRILDEYGWQYFLDLVEKELGGAKNKSIILAYGNTGEEVKNLQRRLRAWGYDVTIDGSFGPATLTALKKFQNTNELDVDGIAGPLTWEKLNGKAVEAKFNDIAGHWAENVITKAASMGLMEGDGSGSFRPDEPITRAEVAALAVRILTLREG